MIATIGPEGAKLPAHQQRDKNLATIISYLKSGILPEDDRLARHLVLSESQYVLEDDVLHRVEQDSTLRIILPEYQREELFKDAHSGVFGAHLSDMKVHSKLQYHYWWSSMRADSTR